MLFVLYHTYDVIVIVFVTALTINLKSRISGARIENPHQPMILFQCFIYIILCYQMSDFIEQCC